MDHPFSPDDLVVLRLDGPPEGDFDCGRTEQTAFFRERAYHDHMSRLSETYRYYVRGLLAGFATVCKDALQLGRRERDRSITYQKVSAVKLAQLGVALRFQGMGLGRLIVADIINRARRDTAFPGRYVTVDARPDVAGWYELQGFVRNELDQQTRQRQAIEHGRDPASIAVSMRYDLGPR